ncbi:hypothetical protein BDR07DRAFT_1443242 [Suillus spraguei]|nr:hypothetical protein BDR07DRAFT_1443242 [Suillus spraguei]
MSSVMRLARLAGNTRYCPPSGERFIAWDIQGRKSLEKQESGTLINVLSTCIRLASSIDPTNSFLSTRAPPTSGAELDPPGIVAADEVPGFFWWNGPWPWFSL